MPRRLPQRAFATAQKAWLGASVARQLFLAMFGSMAAATSLYFLIDVWASNRRLLAMERSTLQAVFPVLQGMVEDSMLRGPREHLRELFANPGGSGERLFLLDPEKRAVNLSDLGAGRKVRRSPAPEFDPRANLVMDFPMRARPACARCHGEGPSTSLRAGREILGYVRVAAEHQEKLKAVSAHVRTHIAVLALIMVLFAFWALWIVRRVVQAPLSRIVAAMAAVAQGRLDTRIDSAPAGELRAIATGFNSMVHRLEVDRREILELHRRQVAHMERLVAVGEVAAHLAHEVRNPLTGIGSTIQILQQETPPDSPRREVLAKILAQLNRMDQAMANFLGFARLPEAVVRPFDLREPLNRVTFLVGPRLRAQKITLERRWPESLPAVSGDPAQIEQVFLNLCLNAIQAMPEGGALTLRAKSEPSGTVLLEFSDTGHGIPASQLELVFRPFFTTREKGSGLGLPIARQIVMAHGGEIWIESIPERGTSVFVRLRARNGEGA